jgi:hypothetical protein
LRHLRPLCLNPARKQGFERAGSLC